MHLIVQGAQAPQSLQSFSNLEDSVENVDEKSLRSWQDDKKLREISKQLVDKTKTTKKF